MVNLLKVSDANKRWREEEEMCRLSGEEAIYDAHVAWAHILSKCILYPSVSSFVFRRSASTILKAAAHSQNPLKDKQVKY